MKIFKKKVFLQIKEIHIPNEQKKRTSRKINATMLLLFASFLSLVSKGPHYRRVAELLFTCVIAQRSRVSNWITDLDNSDLILVTMRFVCIRQIFRTIFHVSSEIFGKFCIFFGSPCNSHYTLKWSGERNRLGLSF